MRAILLGSLCCAALGTVVMAADPPRTVESKTHLFIFSGQSNMARFDPEHCMPLVRKAYPDDTFIVVKDALGGQPISRWVKDWKSPRGEQPKVTGDLYERLMAQVRPAIEGKQFDTITFLWMQGETDALKGDGAVYAASLRTLIATLRKDLARDDIDVVIGRISDYGSTLKDPKDWAVVREALVEVATSDAHGAWIDTDDLNGEKDDIHYDKEGRKVQGERFAAKAIELLKKTSAANGTR